MEEAQNKKQELRDNVKAWKKKHPDWLQSEAMETAKSKLTARTYRARGEYLRRKRILTSFLVGLLCLFLFVSGSSLAYVRACTNFKIIDEETVFFGNSEDYALKQISDTFITFVPRGQTWNDGSRLKYGAVVVGYANGTGNSWIQGGMNEEGLAFDSTSVPHTEPNLHEERAPSLVPEIFTSGTIDEVIEYKNTHGVYQQEGSVQSFYVDKTGESVVFNIGEDGEFQFHTNDEIIQLATNFYVEDPFRRNPNSDALRRYDTAEQALSSLVANDDISIESITLVLNSVHFEGPAVNTLYSNIFDVTNGDIYLYFFHQFEEVVKFNLEEELAKGRHTYRISDLFTQEIVDGAFNEYHEFPLIIRSIPTDLLLLFATIALDAILVIALVFAVVRKTIRRRSEVLDETPNQNAMMSDASRGVLLQIIISLPVVWSLLSFPMIYWNHRGDWWTFFDIPILNLPLHPFYAQHNIFLLTSLLGIVSVAFLLSSFANRGEAIQLARRGLEYGRKNRLRNAIVLGSPILIGAFYLVMESFGVIQNVDWLMFALMYPLIVAMLTMLAPIAEKKGNSKKNLPQTISKMNLLKTGILLILTWSLWFLPILLTGKTDQMYALLFTNLSLSIIVLTFSESAQ